MQRARTRRRCRSKNVFACASVFSKTAVQPCSVVEKEERARKEGEEGARGLSCQSIGTTAAQHQERERE